MNDIDRKIASTRTEMAALREQIGAGEMQLVQMREALQQRVGYLQALLDMKPPKPEPAAEKPAEVGK